MNPIHISIGIIVIIALLGGLWWSTTNIKECEKDEDCIPAEPLVGARYICEDGVCVKKPFGNPVFCESSADCVSATCCHPDACINEDYQPDCKGILCTLECRPNTMDCGQGRCVCIDNTCQVEWL